MRFPIRLLSQRSRLGWSRNHPLSLKRHSTEGRKTDRQDRGADTTRERARREAQSRSERAGWRRALRVELGLLERALWGRSTDERRPGERVGVARCRRSSRARCAGRARRSAPAAEGTRGDLALCLALCQESGEITRTRRRTGREKLSASGAPTGSSQLSRFPARAVLAGSVEARGWTAQLDRDRYRSFSVGRN